MADDRTYDVAVVEIPMVVLQTPDGTLMTIGTYTDLTVAIEKWYGWHVQSNLTLI